MVADWVPLTWEAFRDYLLGGTFMSAQGLEVVRTLLRGDAVARSETGLSKREWAELMRALQLDPTAETVGSAE